ncbi:MAG: leucine-rich repeat domain-containing protein [Clostridiales bacterium]|jgi:hypothetical protein|nr:leucine-rich repeat domain-containing protein [Clostridiales bacterium]
MLDIEKGVLIRGKYDGPMDVIRLPEGIERIGRNALSGLSCKKLEMPSTLKTIGAYAFDSATIGAIDFGDCKLETIETSGFSGCEAVAALPDTVRKIGTTGCSALKMAKGGKLALPRSLRYLGARSICLHDVKEIEVDWGTVTDESNLASALYSCAHTEITIVIRVMREGKELYNFVLYRGTQEGTTYDQEFKYYFVGADGLDFNLYDQCFMDVSRVYGRMEVAVNRLLVPYMLSEELEAMYRKYVLNHYEYLMDGKEEDIYWISKYGEAHMIGMKNLKALLEFARKRKNVELVAYLMDLINREGGAKAKSLKM